MQWKKKKIEAREDSLAAERADRAKNDRMRQVFSHTCIYKLWLLCWMWGIHLKLAFSFIRGRELFLSDASLFVDDAEAYDKYQSEEETDTDQKVNNPHSSSMFNLIVR